MSAPLLLGVDLGTSSCKVVLYQGDRMVAAEVAPIVTEYPGPGLAEQDPGAWWDTVCTLVRRVTGSVAGDVAAIGVTAQSDSLVAVDADAEPVHPCILWMDGRGDDELQQLRAALGDERIREATGLRPSLSFTAAKVAWLRTHEPDAFGRVRWISQPKDYLVMRMTGTAVTDPSSASRSMLFDRLTSTWWPEMSELVGARARPAPSYPAVGFDRRRTDPRRRPRVPPAPGNVGRGGRGGSCGRGARERRDRGRSDGLHGHRDGRPDVHPCDRPRR